MTRPEQTPPHGQQTEAPVVADAASAPTTEQLLAYADRYMLKNYRPAPVLFERGHGTVVEDSTGKAYLDFAGGVAVTALGHGHPKLAAAIAEQAAKLVHVSNYFYNTENVLLAKELCERTGYHRAFFCNSGGEANEAMFKLARRHFFLKGEKNRYRFIAFHHSFHGRTVATVNLTGNASYKEGFGPPLEGITHVAYGDLDAVREAMATDVAGVFVETVQGEGGVLPAPPGFMRGLRDLCDAHGALLLIDEVQTGIGRTGRFLGSHHDGVRGDAITLAKGLGGGVPIGALLLDEKLENGLGPGTHGSTFGGNPLASAAARCVLRVLDEEHLVEEAARKGELLGKRLAEVAAEHPDLCVGERGLGLLRGIILKKGVDARVALAKARERGLLLTIAGGQVLRFTPPLNVLDEEIDEAARRASDALKALRIEMM
ncbi:MAG: acetylornithine/succinylornithine family transaminase [Polyangiaceae bacterium]